MAFSFKEVTEDTLGSLGGGVREEKVQVQSCDRLMGAVRPSYQRQSVSFLVQWVEDEMALNFGRRGKYFSLHLAA